jgi:hypothetical protein
MWEGILFYGFFVLRGKYIRKMNTEAMLMSRNGIMCINEVVMRACRNYVNTGEG